MGTLSEKKAKNWDFEKLLLSLNFYSDQTKNNLFKSFPWNIKNSKALECKYTNDNHLNNQDETQFTSSNHLNNQDETQFTSSNRFLEMKILFACLLTKKILKKKQVKFKLR